MAYSLKKVYQNEETTQIYEDPAEAMKAFLDESEALGQRLKQEDGQPPRTDGGKVILEELKPDNEADEVRIQMTEADLTPAGIKRKLKAAGAGEHATDKTLDNFSAMTMNVYKTAACPGVTSAKCRMRIPVNGVIHTYCLEFPLFMAEAQEEALKPTAGPLDISPSNCMVCINEQIISKIPTTGLAEGVPKEIISKRREGKRYLKYEVDKQITAYILQRLDTTIDCLNKCVLKLLTFAVCYGYQDRTFSVKPEPDQGYRVTFPAEDWFTAINTKATGRAYMELQESLDALPSLLIKYNSQYSRLTEDGTFVLIQHARRITDELTGKQAISITFSAPFSDMLYKLKRSVFKIPIQAFKSDNRRNPLTFPIILQLVKNTARNLSKPTKRNRVKVGTLLNNLRGQMTPYEHYKRKSDWKRKIALPFLRDLYKAYKLGALIGYRLEWKDGTGIDERPPRSYEEWENVYLLYWPNIDEDGQPPQIEFIPEAKDGMPRFWGVDKVCSVGRKTVQIIKETRPKSNNRAKTEMFHGLKAPKTIN